MNLTLEMLQPLSLELALAGGTLLILVLDLLVGARPASRFIGIVTALLLAGLLAASFVVDSSGAITSVYRGGEGVLFFKRLFLVIALLAVLGGLDHVRRESRWRQGEYYLLMLSSLLGMMILPGARDLILLVVAFELMGIPLYVLAAYGKDDVRDPAAPVGDPAAARLLSLRRTSEAGLKLYLVGAASTATTLFGLSLAAGAVGSTHLAALASAPASPMVSLGLMLVLAGMGFKIGVAPFHMWVPDTYQGSSTPFVAFLSVAPKVAGIAAVMAVFPGGFSGHKAVWVPALIALCATTLIAGNLLAVPQTQIKRLLGYSGVAQIGYILMGIIAGTRFGTGMALFYMAGYAVTNVGAFLVVHAAATARQGEALDTLEGMARRSPGLAMAMLIFLLSLAGIPFVVGFWAKVYVFMAAYRAGLVWLVVLGAVFAVVALFYYLQVARSLYGGAKPTETPERLRVSPALRVAIGLCVLGVVGMGLWPAPFVDAALSAATFLPAI